MGVAILLSGLFYACKKGENLPGAAYGKIGVTSTFSGTATPLLIQVDGVTKDTLSFEKQSLSDGIVTPVGARKYTLMKLADRSVLYETDLNIEVGKTTPAPNFLYDGVTALFDDSMSAKPTKDSMLVRFINQVPNFPVLIDLEIRATILGQPTSVLVKAIKGVNKEKFSDFVQLPNPENILAVPPGENAIFIIVATDPANNNAVLMSLQSNNHARIYGVGGAESFTANGILSIGIQPPSRRQHLAVNIFGRVAQ